MRQREQMASLLQSRHWTLPLLLVGLLGFALVHGGGLTEPLRQLLRAWDPSPASPQIYRRLSNKGVEDDPRKGSGDLSTNRSQSHGDAWQTEAATTNDLSRDALKQRKTVYGGVFLAVLGMLSCGGIAVFLKKTGKLSSWPTTPQEEKAPLIQQSEGQGQAEQRQDQAETGPGMGGLSPEELKEVENDLSLKQPDLSPEERKAKIAEWAQQKAAAERKEHESFLRRRFWILVLLLVVYIAACIWLPLSHMSEATCTRGFFWETHLQFLMVFVITKVVELWWILVDPMIEFDSDPFHFMLKFLPSFIGYVDGYGDATAIIIAHQCPDEMAQNLSIWMAVSYLLGVICGQWMVLMFLASQDPSQACLLKLVHMDFLASCITLPKEQKSTWDLIAMIRTLGEDIPQAILQSLYIIYVKRNVFMLISVAVSVLSSVKAMMEARARALEAAGAAEDFDKRERDLTLYSCSQDHTIRLWDIQTGACTKVIDAGSCVNLMAATQGKVYSTDDRGTVTEWTLTGDKLRTFKHDGHSGVVLSNDTHLYTWFQKWGARTETKEWDLASGECMQTFKGPRLDPRATLCVKGRALFTNSSEDFTAIAEWSLDDGKLFHTYHGHSAALNALFATASRLFSGARDGTVKEWSRETGTCMRTFNDHFQGARQTQLLVIGNMLYSAGRSQDIIERSLETGIIKRRFEGHEGNVLGLTALNRGPDQDYLFSCSEDGEIKKWLRTTGECVQNFEGHTEWVNNLLFQFQED